MADCGVQASLASTGESYDNPLAKTIIGLHKTEVICRRGSLRHAEAVLFATIEWADWLKNRCLLGPIGEISPFKLEQAYYRRKEPQIMGAGFTQRTLREPEGIQVSTVREFVNNRSCL